MLYHSLDSLNLENYKYKIICTSPLIIQIDDFLTNYEVGALLFTAQNKYERSVVVEGNTGQAIHNKRTSTSAFFKRSEIPVIRDIEARVSKLANIQVNQLEPFQLVKYEIGQEYDFHHDYFHISEPAGQEEILQYGQRYITLFVYLVEPEEGGTTDFSQLNVSIKGKKGSAILWFNLDKNGNVDPRTKHGGMPVIKGRKVAMNIWSREKKYE